MSQRIRFSPFEEVYRRIVRSFVLSLLEPWKEQHIRFAMANDILLATLLRADRSAYHKFRMVGKAVPRWESFFTTDFVIEWLKGNRDDLVVVFAEPEARAWLARNVEALKEAAWGEERALSAEEFDKLLDIAAANPDLAAVVEALM